MFLRVMASDMNVSDVLRAANECGMDVDGFFINICMPSDVPTCGGPLVGVKLLFSARVMFV